MKHLVTFLLLLLAVQAEARTFWVSPTGTDSGCTSSATPPAANSGYKSTITAGMGCLAAGDVLNIRSGTYNEGLSEYFATYARGSSSSSLTTIQAYNGESVTIRRSAQSNIPLIQPISAANYFMLWKDLIFDCTNVISAQSCIKIEQGANEIRFQNVEIKNTGVADSGAGHGVLVIGNNNQFLQMRVHDNGTTFNGFSGGYGYYIEGNNNLVENNDIYGNGGYGVHLFNQDAPYPTDNIVRYSRIHGNGVAGRAVAGVLISRAANSVYDNLIYNNVTTDTAGIAIGFCVTIGCGGSVVYNNTIYGNQGNGIEVTGTASGATQAINIKNNIVRSNGASISNTGASITFAANICDAIGTGCASGTNPNMVAPGSGNFQLQGNSTAAIDQGVDLGSSYNRDYAGTLRPQGGAGWDIGAYEFIPSGVPPPVSQLVLALPLDDGSGSTAQDVSGQKNNATLGGGATWDNAGKYGKAIAFDGTGYLTVPAVPSLALAPAMTLEAWIYPTVTFSGFAAVMVQNYQYYLYASTDLGYCPAAPSNAPIGGYSTSGGNNVICATSVPSPNEWSHLAMTYDGAMMTFYLNGNVIASRSSSNPMVQASNDLTIGKSMFGEYFTGKIDEARVYNYARTPAQIVSDMNTPLIGVPGKVVEIAAPASVEISSASSIEISAD